MMKKYVVTLEDARQIMKSILRNHGFVTLRVVAFINRSLSEEERDTAVMISVGDYDNDVLFGEEPDGRVIYSNYVVCNNKIYVGERSYLRICEDEKDEAWDDILYIPDEVEDNPEDDGWEYYPETHEWCFEGFNITAYWYEDPRKVDAVMALSIFKDGGNAYLECATLDEARRIVRTVIDGDYTIDEEVNPYTLAGTLILKVDMDDEPVVKNGRKLRAPSREYRRNCKAKDMVPKKGTSCFRKGYHKYEKQWKEECRRTARREGKKQCRI